mmetsp:Transcript_6109/g.15815  ORF Transcript_6109/g.15815 Transcript_6109/m.15815 type:complete len:132 (-) Transcript_6109:15-410(-)
MAPPASLENVIGGKLKLKTKKTGGSIGKHNSSGRPSSPAAVAAAGLTSGGHGKVLSKTLDKKRLTNGRAKETRRCAGEPTRGASKGGGAEITQGTPARNERKTRVADRTQRPTENWTWLVLLISNIQSFFF